MGGTSSESTTRRDGASHSPTGPITARTVKLTAISFLVTLSYFMLRAGVTADRVQRDEVLVIYDLSFIVRFDRLPEPASYGVGNGYALLTGVLLDVLDYGYPALELLSPVVGACVVGVITLCAVAIVREVRPRVGPWVAIGFPASLLVFAGFTVRIAETTHKKYTFALTFVALLVTFVHYRKNMTDDRIRLLFMGLVSSIALFNYVWAIVYGFVAILAQFTTSIPRLRAVLGGGTPLVVAYVLPVYLPTAWLNVDYTQIFITLLRGKHVASIRILDVGGITDWPVVQVLGVPVSTWFVYAYGIFAVAVVAGLAGIHALSRFRDEPTPFVRFYTVIGLWFTFVIGMMLVAGDLATFRRVLVIPGAVGVTYALYTLSLPSTDVLTERRKRIAMQAIIIVLLVGSVLAIPRAVLDGGLAPYDYYAEENEVSKFEWWDDHAPLVNCLQTHQFVDLTASQMVWGIDRVQRTTAVPYDPRNHVVYESGPEAFLSCVPVPT